FRNRQRKIERPYLAFNPPTPTSKSRHDAPATVGRRPAAVKPENQVAAQILTGGRTTDAPAPASQPPPAERARDRGRRARDRGRQCRGRRPEHHEWDHSEAKRRRAHAAAPRRADPASGWRRAGSRRGDLRDLRGGVMSAKRPPSAPPDLRGFDYVQHLGSGGF